MNKKTILYMVAVVILIVVAVVGFMILSRQGIEQPILPQENEQPLLLQKEEQALSEIGFEGLNIELKDLDSLVDQIQP